MPACVCVCACHRYLCNVLRWIPGYLQQMRKKQGDRTKCTKTVEIGGGILQHCARVVQNHRVALTFGFASCSLDFSAWHYWAGRFCLGCACRFTCGGQQTLHVSCCLLLAGLPKKGFPWNWIPQESPPKNAKTKINKDTKQAAEEPVQFLLAVTALETLEVLSLLSSQSEQHIVSKSGTALHRLAILIVFFLNHPFWGIPMESSTLTLSSLSLYLRAFGSIPRPCTVLSLWYGEASPVQWVRHNEPWKCVDNIHVCWIFPNYSCKSNHDLDHVFLHEREHRKARLFARRRAPNSMI